MKLRTHIQPERSPLSQLDYGSKLLLLGSCFSDHIANKLDYFKFQCLANPFGILFHPVAICNTIKRAIQATPFKDDDVFISHEIWKSYSAHSSLNQLNKDACIEALNTAQQQTISYLQTASHIIITLGTAWVYTHLSTNSVVANCHKQPNNLFDKSLLSVDQIHKSLETMADAIRSVNPNAVLLFTISPVRHLRDGVVENNQSKAHLITALHQFISTNTATYFPAYEIMMDDLRDYRFYKDDLIHPNALAISYIWDKFLSVWMDSNSFPLMKQIESIQKRINHRPFNSKTQHHQEFLSKLQRDITTIAEQYPHMKFN